MVISVAPFECAWLEHRPVLDVESNREGGILGDGVGGVSGLDPYHRRLPPEDIGPSSYPVLEPHPGPVELRMEGVVAPHSPRVEEGIRANREFLLEEGEVEEHRATGTPRIPAEPPGASLRSKGPAMNRS